MYISAGPASAMRIVPAIDGLFEEDAVGTLAAAGLEPGDVSEEYSDTLEIGYVIRQGIAPETQVKEGTAVPYTVSLGPEERRYVTSINEHYNLGGSIGPGAVAADVRVMIRLKQVVNGQVVYQTLMDTMVYNGTEDVPISFSEIEGEPGVSSGEVEVVNADTDQVLAIYPVTFTQTH